MSHAREDLAFDLASMLDALRVPFPTEMISGCLSTLEKL